MGILTITTDFGLTDGYVGVMKGVIWGIAPDVNIVDITHQIPSQDVFQGALTLLKISPYFPDGSVHVAVIDPGVGTHRRALAARIGNQYYVLPDNGLLTYLLEIATEEKQFVEMVDLNQRVFWLEEISHVFHGRDIFAPIAAHLSNGKKLKSMGTPINDPVLLNLPKVQINDKSISGEVISIDQMGNITTNINGDQLKLMGGNGLIRVNNLVISRTNQLIEERTADKVIGLLGRRNELIIVFTDMNDFYEAHLNVGDKVIISKGDR